MAMRWIPVDDTAAERPSPELRVAVEADIPAIERLIARSLAGLASGHYDLRVIRAARGRILGVDRRLIEEGTYYVAEAAGRIVGSGGWSGGGRLFGTDAVGRRHAVPIPEVGDEDQKTAVIRAFYVDPDWARRGIGRALLTKCETEARRAGYRRLVLVALLSGVELFRSMGFAPVKPETLELPGDLRMVVLHMTKRIAMTSQGA